MIGKLRQGKGIYEEKKKDRRQGRKKGKKKEGQYIGRDR